jgi:hypothetical protein
MKKTKDQFRIKDLRTENYVKNGTKYHWASLNNAISALRQRCNGHRYYDPSNASKIEHFVIERYELVVAETINPVEMIKAMEVEEGKQNRFYKSNQEKVNILYGEIKKVASVPDMKAKDIKKLVTAGILNAEKSTKLGKLFDEIEEIEASRYKSGID